MRAVAGPSVRKDVTTVEVARHGEDGEREAPCVFRCPPMLLRKFAQSSAALELLPL